MALELNGTTGVSLVQDGVVTTADIDDGAVTAAKIGSLPEGSVLQVVSTTKTDTFSVSSLASNSASSITGLSASITPTSTSSKILVMYSVCMSAGIDNRQATAAIVIERNGTEVKTADSAGSRGTVNSFFSVNANDDDNATAIATSNFIDEPSSTSALTYQVLLYNIGSSAQSFVCNRTWGDANSNNFRTRSTSSITVMEIAG